MDEELKMHAFPIVDVAVVACHCVGVVLAVVRASERRVPRQLEPLVNPVFYLARELRADHLAALREPDVAILSVTTS